MLTQKREAFACAYVRLGVAAKAYAESHDASRMAPATIRKRAADLLKRPDVKARIAELQAAVAKEVVLDRALVLRELHRLAKMAMGDLPIRKIVTMGRGKDAKPEEHELHHVDIMGAARAWELIGRADEIRLFENYSAAAGRAAGQAAGEAIGEVLSDIDRARRIAFILEEAKRQMTQPRTRTDNDDDHHLHH
jgi:hypothetical protein